MENETRIKKIKDYCSKVFFHEDFKDPRRVRDERIESLYKSFSSEVRSNAYQAKLLNSEEETFLFKKMNYLKYKAKRLVERASIPESCLTRAESLVMQAKEIRNFIAESNFRLATQILKCNISYYKKNSLVEALLSDAYFDIIKSVDYFNWTLGNRFSTYATWVLKKNFFRESKDKQKKAKKIVSLEDSDVSFCSVSGESPFKLELDHKSHQQVVATLLSLLESGDCTKNQRRQVLFLKVILV
jgi:DNA-directed RNA polymerase sigma subunit (sigma70/sigma32)